ncbi:MAG: hypothetical protein BGN88_00345 [Clostridiales bacterium 43-6]|nr:MAG: hypothetical protein BGN88_00345 [Clostridiales bacterium 43-6]
MKKVLIGVLVIGVIYFSGCSSSKNNVEARMATTKVSDKKTADNALAYLNDIIFEAMPNYFTNPEEMDNEFILINAVNHAPYHEYKNQDEYQFYIKQEDIDVESKLLFGINKKLIHKNVSAYLYDSKEQVYKFSAFGVEDGYTSGLIQCTEDDNKVYMNVKIFIQADEYYEMDGKTNLGSNYETAVIKSKSPVRKVTLTKKDGGFYFTAFEEKP